MSEGGRPIRLIDLATHSAGLPREVPHAPGPPDNPFVNVTHDAFVAWLKANPLLFTPGTSISYSNFGFDLLAAALAAAAHQPYPDLLDARVLRPLGLRDTTFAPSESQAARIMQGTISTVRRCRTLRPARSSSAPAASTRAPRDLLAWLEWHLDRFGNDRAAERLIDHAAYLLRDGLNAVFGMDESGHMDAMGLGWVIMAPERDRPLILQKAGGLWGCFPMSPSRRRAGSASAPPSTASMSPLVWRWPRPPTISSPSLRRARVRPAAPSESVRKHHAGLHSFRSMRRIEARRRKARALRLRHSQSLASLRQRPSQARVRSTIQRLGRTTKRGG